MRSIAIVDDHKLFSAGLTLLLEELEQPLEIRSFTTPEELCDEAKFKPCLIILDFYLPGLSFLETMQQLQSMSQAQVLVVSASSSPSDYSRALAAGAVACLHKHVEPDILREAVVALLSGNIPDVIPRAALNLERFGLTERQLEVLILVAKGYSNKEIAASFEVSPETIKTHLKSIYTRIDVQNRMEAIEFIREYGIV